MSKVNVLDQLALMNEVWSQKVLADANGQLYKIAKGLGETRWHKHDDQDELFLVLEGKLLIQTQTENIELGPGDLYVVPRGVMHCPVTETGAGFLIVGSAITSTPEGGKPNN